MATKLTLTLDSHVIAKAKAYARERNTSLSKMVEFFFKYVSEGREPENRELPPITKSLSGMVKNTTSKNDKDVLVEALLDKYS